MVLADLVLWLETDGIGTRAATLFYGLDVPDPDAYVNLMEYGGLHNEQSLGQPTVNLEFPSVQAVVRGAPNDYDGPRLKAQQVSTSFAKITNQVIGSTKYGSVQAKQPPHFLKRDASFRVYFVVNFDVMKAYSTS